MTKSLIAFYSRADENYMHGILENLKTGNTALAAGIIKRFTDADLFEIKQIKPYSKSYNECIAQAQEDQKRSARPELKEIPDSINQYNIIYLGYPNYWGTMPMAVFTFLEHFNFTGKIIRPFCTHEGSGLGTSEEDIKLMCPGAKIGTGLAINGSSVLKSENKIERWVKSEF